MSEPTDAEIAEQGDLLLDAQIDDYLEDRRMNQKQRILKALRRDPVCGTTFLDWRMPRYAARVNELRNEGHQITTTRCTLHSHASSQVMYQLHE